jgi:flavodoxin
MKGLVVYDSVYGNTKLVAEMIAEGIRAEGHEAAVQSAKDDLHEKLNVDFILIGSPTRMGRMTGPSKKLIDKLSKSSWTKPVGFFDTVMPGVVEKKGSTAAQRLYYLAKGTGLDAHAPVFHATVTGMRGPLQGDTADIGKAFVRGFLASLRH